MPGQPSRVPSAFTAWDTLRFFAGAVPQALTALTLAKSLDSLGLTAWSVIPTGRRCATGGSRVTRTSPATDHWSVTTRTQGGVQSAVASQPPIEMALLGIPEGFTAAEIQ